MVNFKRTSTSGYRRDEPHSLIVLSNIRASVMASEPTFYGTGFYTDCYDCHRTVARYHCLKLSVLWHVDLHQVEPWRISTRSFARPSAAASVSISCRVSLWHPCYCYLAAGARGEQLGVQTTPSLWRPHLHPTPVMECCIQLNWRKIWINYHGENIERRLMPSDVGIDG